MPIPENTKRWPNVGLLLGQRRRKLISGVVRADPHYCPGICDEVTRSQLPRIFLLHKLLYIITIHKAKRKIENIYINFIEDNQNIFFIHLFVIH